MLLLPLAVTLAVVLIVTMGWFRRERSFAGKHVLITGGSTGIGLSIAQILAQQGASVTLVARSQSKLDAAKAQIEGATGSGTARVHAASADVTKAADVSSLAAWTVKSS